MKEILGFLGEYQWVLLAASLLLIVIVVVSIAIVRRQQKKLFRHMADTEEHLRDLIRVSGEQSQTERNAERESINANLRGMSESIVRVMGEMSRTQQQQLDSFGGQIRAMNRDDEDRMERMRSDIDSKMQQYDNLMTNVNQTLEVRLSENERRLHDMRSILTDSLHHMQEDNDRKLERIRETVDEKLNSTLDQRLGESFKTVSERLEQVYKGLGEMQTLATGVGDLKKLMSGIKTRGIWGEVQLRAILEQILAPGQYEENVAVSPGNSERVEFAVCFPGRSEQDQKVYLPIDAKFPTEDYQQILEAEEAGNREEADSARRQLAAHIRIEAKKIRDKYIDPPYTTDFAVMFIPSEGLYAELLRKGDIIEQLQTQFHIVITGPTTLVALLNSLQMGFRTIAIERRTSEVWELLGAVKTEFGHFADLLSRTQQRLNQASATIEDAARKTRTIQRKLQNVQEIGDRDAERLIGITDKWEVNEEESD